MPSPRTLVLACLRCMVAGLLALLIVRMTLLTSYRVAGSSMLEALEDGDRILVCQAGWLMPAPAVGDTVVAEVEDEVLVKRVAAVPGDSIGMSQGRVLRNGLVVAESVPAALDCSDSFPAVRLGADEYFLLGDHRRVSVDSREFGPVRARQLLGRVLLRVHGGGLSQVAALERLGS